MAYLEHANVTVRNPDQTAQRMINLFDWHIRWSGASMNKGHTIHVGTQECYIALYSHIDRAEPVGNSINIGNLNHLAVVVKDLDTTSDRAKSLGLEPFNFGNYEPGKRFYVMMDEELEIEIISYN